MVLVVGKPQTVERDQKLKNNSSSTTAAKRARPTTMRLSSIAGASVFVSTVLLDVVASLPRMTNATTQLVYHAVWLKTHNPKDGVWPH